MSSRPWTIDFETEAILPAPDYPPRPVGVALRAPTGRLEYLAWGHPCENNTDEETARRRLASLWQRETLLFHNAKFDLSVARRWLGLEPPSWHRILDTMIEAFLHDPNAPAVSLKPMAEEYLGLPPSEEARLRDWIIEHVPEARRKKKQWGAYIARGPGKLVGVYAKGDVSRTYKLHRFFEKKGIPAKAYERERRTLVALLDMELEGVPVNVGALEADVSKAEVDLSRVDTWLHRRLGDIEIDKRAQLIEAFEKKGIVEEWILTDKGHPSTSIENLREVVVPKHQVLVDVLEFRSLLANQLRTFARPWLEMLAPGDVIQFQWNQVRQASERSYGRSIGARTGRLSSIPNGQNIPREPYGLVFQRRKARGIDSEEIWLPTALDGVSLIDLRDRIAAPRGSRILKRDYSQQELRILAHFARGQLMKIYADDPKADLHVVAQRRINAMLGTNFKKKPIKNTGFGIIYGMGLAKLADQMNEDIEVARRLRKAYRAIFPGLPEFERKMQRDGALGKSVETWGGRPFVCEPAKVIGNQLRTFEYKMINTLIQGSAADCTKEAMVRYHEHPKREGRMLLSVHDEIVALARTKEARRDMALLTECMESVEFNVPMLSDGAIGKTWREAA